MLKTPIGTNDHIQGDPGAPIVLVEYGDYECPHCGHAYPIVKAVQRHFGERLAFVFRNFPLKQAHPNAESAAEASEFAATRQRFWEMHDALFENQENLEPAFLLTLAEAVGLPSAELRAALENRQYSHKVQEDFRGGVRSGVNGTPTFFINQHRHDGPFEFEDLVASIDARLA